MQTMVDADRWVQMNLTVQDLGHRLVLVEEAFVKIKEALDKTEGVLEAMQELAERLDNTAGTLEPESVEPDEDYRG